MAVVADATAQSIEGQNDPKNDSSIIEPTPPRNSRIKEHPFMKEVSAYSSFSFCQTFIQYLAARY